MTADSIPHGGTATGSLPEKNYRALAIAVTPVLLVLGAWMLRHGYFGITHDATLYMLIALKSIAPEAYSRDLFFAFGSQGDYTLSGVLLGKLVSSVGLAQASLISTVIGQAIWISGAIILISRISGGLRAATLPLLGIVCLSTTYGGYGVFNYGETFATPRIYAEGLTFWGLWAVAHGRLLLAGGLFLGGLVLHPIMALTGIAMASVYLALGDRRWWFAILAGLVAIGVLAALGVSPLDRLGHTIDSVWLDLIQQRNFYVFPTLWLSADWYKTVGIAGFGVAAAVVMTGWQQRLIVAAMIVGVGGIAATIVTVDLLHNVLAMQLQFYRTAWLLHVFGNFGIALLVVRLWQNRVNAVPLIALITVAWVVCFMLLPGLGAVISIFAALLAATQLRRKLPTVSRRLTITVCAFAVLALATAFGLRLYISADRIIQAATEGTAPPGVFLYFLSIDAIVVLILFVLLARSYPKLVTGALPVAASVIFVLAIATWDRRGDWARGVEGNFDVSALQALIPENATVYFERDSRGAWLMLRRATYGSVSQGAGINFNRDSALAYAKATGNLTTILGRQPMDIFRREDDIDTTQATLVRADIDKVCTAATDLDFMLLSRRVEDAYSVVWMPPKPFYNVRALTRGNAQPPLHSYYLYDCRKIRSDAATG